MPVKRAYVDLTWGGCLLTDKRPEEEMQAFVGGEAQYCGHPGTVRAITLMEGKPPWDGPPAPRPVYHVEWEPADV